MNPPVPPDGHHWLFDRRHWLRWAATSLASLPLGCQRTPRPPTASEALHEELMRFPGKVPMRAINHRPPCLETPWRYFREDLDLTPNEAFFVRWHLQMLPTTVDPRTWRLKVHGEVKEPLDLSLQDLKRMEPVSVTAVCQCSGNSRAFFEPHVPGAQWRNGGMGNALWTGVPLHDVLRRAGLKAKAMAVAFHSLDRAGLPTVPDFTKSLSVEHPTTAEPLLAYEMNGQPLPLLNGFPLRVVVPGWYATYWVKALSELVVLPRSYDGFWMAKAYQIPTTGDASENPNHLAATTIPINRMNVRSFFTSPDDGDRIPAGKPAILEGIAFDGGAGIRKVEISADEGETWMKANLGEDRGNFSFRRWRFHWQPQDSRPYVLQVRAISRGGEKQPERPSWNRSGFMRNEIEKISVRVG